jgi:hypothetical protein
MISRQYRALSECIRDRCKRTGTGKVLRIAEKFNSIANLLLKIPLLFFCYEPLCIRLRRTRIWREIIHGAIKSKNPPTRQLFLIEGFFNVKGDNL